MAQIKHQLTSLQLRHQSNTSAIDGQRNLFDKKFKNNAESLPNDHGAIEINDKLRIIFDSFFSPDQIHVFTALPFDEEHDLAFWILATVHNYLSWSRLHFHGLLTRVFLQWKEAIFLLKANSGNMFTSLYFCSSIRICTLFVTSSKSSIFFWQLRCSIGSQEDSCTS